MGTSTPSTPMGLLTSRMTCEEEAAEREALKVQDAWVCVVRAVVQRAWGYCEAEVG